MRVHLRCCVFWGALVFVTGAFAPAAANAHPRRVPRLRHTRHLYPTVDATRNQDDRNELAGGEFSPQGPPLTFQGGNDGIGVTTGTPRVYLVF